MHGVSRARQTPEALEARRQKEQSKLKDYLALTEDVLRRCRACEWSQAALDLTTRLLTINPDFYTIWNYRRDIYIHKLFQNISPEDLNDMLNKDLSLTMSFLRVHPKIYWIWNHRRWCLENTPDGPSANPQVWKQAKWSKELFTVEKMLDADARNFHAWNYRRYVLASMPVQRPDINELHYTTKKIESSFSNFSAWHQRSKVYTTLWEKGELDENKSKDEEFEFVKQAMYVDPNDQSAWIYHRWLIGSGDNKKVLEREISVIGELLSLEPDSKWCLESLVTYKQLLLRKYARAFSTLQLEEMFRTCHDILLKLERIDPSRKARYRDMGVTLRKIQDSLLT